MIEPAHPGLSVTQQCELLGLQRSSYYHAAAPEPEENRRLMRKIDEVYLKYPFFGSRQMTRWLRRQGHDLNRKRVQRLMRLMGLEAIYQKPNLSRALAGQRIYPYLLRNLAVTQPDQIWATDITHVPVQGGHVYLCAVLDWHSRYVLAWELSNTLDASFCVRAVQRALARHGAPKIFNTDQGSSLASPHFYLISPNHQTTDPLLQNLTDTTPSLHGAARHPSFYSPWLLLTDPHRSLPMLKLLPTSLLLIFGLTRALAKHDVVVYGDTLAGISAAMEAARQHKTVVLLSPTPHIGGVATSGLTATDMNRSTSIGGIAREFYQEIYAYYLQPSAWRVQTREEFFELSKKRTYTGKNDALRMQWVYESHVAERILESMLRKAGVAVARRKRIAETPDAVETLNGRIIALRTEDGERHAGRMFVDASYEGDLMARAGVSHIVGREANRDFGETLNGIRLAGVIGAGEQSIDPYLRPGDRASGVLPFIDAKLWGQPGDEDSRTQAYCYRMTLTNDPANRRPIEKPAGFNPLWHEVLVRTLQLAPDTPLQKIISLTPMPNRKTDTNQVNLIGGNRDYQTASHRERERLDRMHRDFAVGMLWVLANDERIPAPIRVEMKPWGWPKDEFTDNDNFPHQLYIREARRMRGTFVMKEENLRRERRVDAGHPVAIGSYMLDSHVVSRVVAADGRLRNEGSHLESRLIRPYGISFYSLVPRREECRNLLVPVCLSATHVAYTSIRMEPVYMALGQAAGAAAALALEADLAVQDIPYPTLHDRLSRAGQVMAIPQ